MDKQWIIDEFLKEIDLWNPSLKQKEQLIQLLEKKIGNENINEINNEIMNLVQDIKKNKINKLNTYQLSHLDNLRKEFLGYPHWNNQKYKMLNEILKLTT